MASEDFLLLTNLIYKDGWSIQRTKFEYHEDSGEKATITLSKNGQTRELQSSAEDFVSFAVQMNKLVNSKGEMKLGKVKNAEKYWKDIENLVDEKQEKTRAAVKSILSGQFKFSFNPRNGIRKILQDRIPVTDPDVRGVKSHFFETYASLLLEGQRLVKLDEDARKGNSDYAGYASKYGRILNRGFLGQANKTNMVDAYRKYIEAVRVDNEDLVRRVDEQLKYVHFLQQLLVGAGKVDIENGARAVVDAYWRLCELCSPMLYAAQVAVALSEDGGSDVGQPSLDNSVKSLRNNPETKNLVECVETILRNSEAHCSSTIVLENGQPTVVAYESRTYPAREIKRFPLSEVTDSLNCLAKSLVLALCMTFQLFEYAFLLLVLGSYEFKMLLVTLDQY